jgi:hypothetical protein
MRTRLLKAVWALLFLLTLVCASALEVKKDRIKLVLYENSGVFSIYYLEDPQQGKYIAFLPDKDPRTSFLSISIWNHIYHMGQSADFKERIEKTATGARFIWVSKRLEVIEDFIIQGDQVKIVLVLFNISAEDQSVGVRYLFDTYLGEKGGPHFVTNNGIEINKETTINSPASLAYWVSPLERHKGSGKIGMRVLTSGDDVTPADKIVFANWKRLDESLWNYRTEEMRDFNDLPYSVNDSAVCQYYNPKVLKSGAARKIVIVIANSSEKDLYFPQIAETEKQTGQESAEQVPEVAEGYPRDYTEIKNNMNSLNRVIGDIDNKISSGSKITDMDINTIRQSITDVEKRINR